MLGALQVSTLIRNMLHKNYNSVIRVMSVFVYNATDGVDAVFATHNSHPLLQ